MNLIIKGDKIPDGVSPADDDPHLFTTIWEKESTAAVIVLWQKSEEWYAARRDQDLRSHYGQNRKFRFRYRRFWWLYTAEKIILPFLPVVRDNIARSRRLSHVGSGSGSRKRR